MIFFYLFYLLELRANKKHYVFSDLFFLHISIFFYSFVNFTSSWMSRRRVCSHFFHLILFGCCTCWTFFFLLLFIMMTWWLELYCYYDDDSDIFVMKMKWKKKQRLGSLMIGNIDKSFLFFLIYDWIPPKSFNLFIIFLINI